MKSLWRRGYESTPQEVIITSILLCRNGERETMIQATSYLSHLRFSSVLGLQRRWEGVSNQTEASVLPRRLHQPTFTFNHHLSQPCGGEAGLTFTPTHLPEKPVFGVLDFFLILLKLKLRDYLPPSQDPYSSWQRSGSDVWDIK